MKIENKNIQNNKYSEKKNISYIGQFFKGNDTPKT